MKNNHSNLRKVIKFILEDLGKFNSRAGKGWGTVQGYVVDPVKPSLGYVEQEIEEDEDLSPVKISRAFRK